mmetsp:Transcript_19199/g.22200  ORF Transcript_19199/g.22200 Transcript_19199/m.22200 type:complete len:116 (-) Transcript_19199:96-443(-)
MFKLQICVFLVAALIGQLVQETQALAFSRRGFLGNVATTTGAVVVAAAGVCPDVASAAPEQTKTRTPFRGGNKAITDTHNGTALNGKQDDVASGLMGKMGLVDIAPYKDAVKAKK